MLHRAGSKRLAWLVAGPAIAALTLPAGAQSPDDPVVTEAVQVTDNPNPVRAHSSPQIAVNPTNGELVIVETNVFEDFGVNVHLSTDEGRSWFDGGDPMVEPFTWNSDLAINGPYFTMVFDEAGTLFLAFSATDPTFADLNRGDRPRHIFLARSDDGGRSWETHTAFEPPADDEDLLDNRRPMLAVDPSDSQYVYLAWISGGGGVMAASSDGGRSFADPVPATEGEERVYQPRLAVDGEGVVHAVIPSGAFDADEPIVRQVSYRRSTDRGLTWSDPVAIEPGSAGFFHNRKQLLAADPESGNLYFTWYGTTEDFPDNEDDNEIFVRTSTDGGDTWSDRSIVNDDADQPNTQHYDPGIAIAPNGRVDVAWYDFRNSPEPEVLPEEFAAPFNFGGFTDVYYSSSGDEGRTWEENIRVTDRIIDRRIGVWSNNVHSHYNVGIASTDDTVYFAWQDSRDGDRLTNAEDVYFASLHRDGDTTAPATGSGSGSEVGARGWAIGGAGVLLGMGLAMVLATLVVRRRAAGDVNRRGAPA